MLLYIMSLSNVPDYLTLYKDEAIVSGNNFSWNIPQQYYSSARGNVCFVSLVECIMSSPDTNEVIVKYHGGQNANNTKNDANVIGLMSMSNPHNQNSGHLQFTSSQNINLLIQARPSTITLSTANIDNSSYVPTNAIFVLKFDYLNQDVVARDYSNTLYNKLI